MKQLCSSLDRAELFGQLYLALKRIDLLLPENAYDASVHLSVQTVLDIRLAVMACETHPCDGACDDEEFQAERERELDEAACARERAADMRESQ